MAMAISVPQYTVDDLDRFPQDGNRYELLDGVLLVTPAPSQLHQLVASRLQAELSIALQKPGHARVVGPGAVVYMPRTQLEPDILVFSAEFPATAHWKSISGHWLAVEVLSQGSRLYDREFKRDAYLALGVREVWLVDLRDKVIEASTMPGLPRRVSDVLRWASPAGVDVVVQLEEIFAGVDDVSDFGAD